MENIDNVVLNREYCEIAKYSKNCCKAEEIDYYNHNIFEKTSKYISDLYKIYIRRPNGFLVNICDPNDAIINEKYRPSTSEDLFGYKHILTLEDGFKQNTIDVAKYLFSFGSVTNKLLCCNAEVYFYNENIKNKIKNSKYFTMKTYMYAIIKQMFFNDKNIKLYWIKDKIGKTRDGKYHFRTQFYFYYNTVELKN